MFSTADLAILAVSLIWGGTFVLVKEALNGVSTLLFLALRFTAAAAVLALFLGRRVLAEPGGIWQGWRGGAVASAFLFLGYALQTAGLRLTTPSRSAFLTGLYIVLVPIFACFVQQCRPQLREAGGVMLAMAGTVLLTAGGEAWPPSGLRWQTGDWLTLGCAAAFAMHILAVKRYSGTMSFERLSLYQIGGVALLSWVLLLPAEEPRLVWSAGLAWALALTSILATAIAFLVYTWAQRRTTATRAALMFATEPVFAGLAGWKWAGDQWTASSLAGAVLILSGILLVEMKLVAGNGHPHR